MNCLRVDELYAFLEGDLPSDLKQKVESHLLSCAQCREAVDTRRLIGEAASGLPPLELPADFTERVMARIARKAFVLPVWLSAAVVGLSALGLVCLILVASGGRSALALLSYVHDSFWAVVKSMTVLTAKIMTALSLAGKLAGPLSRAALKGLSLLTSLISPEVQILIIILTFISLVTIVYALKKKFSFGGWR